MSTSNDKSLYRWTSAEILPKEADLYPCLCEKNEHGVKTQTITFGDFRRYYDKIRVDEEKYGQVKEWLEKVEADQQEKPEGSEAWVSAELLPEEKELINEYRRARLSVRKGEYSLAASIIEHCKIIIGNADDYANDKTNIPELL